MKIEWEEKDVRMGWQVRRPGCRETYVIGYDPTAWKRREAVGGKMPPSNSYHLTSMDDGMMLGHSETEADLAKFLTGGGFQPVSVIAAGE